MRDSARKFHVFSLLLWLCSGVGAQDSYVFNAKNFDNFVEDGKGFNIDSPYMLVVFDPDSQSYLIHPHIFRKLDSRTAIIDWEKPSFHQKQTFLKENFSTYPANYFWKYGPGEWQKVKISKGKIKKQINF